MYCSFFVTVIFLFSFCKCHLISLIIYMDMLRQLITFETYFYKQVSPVSLEEFRILGWALEKAGQPVRIQNSLISSGEGWTAGPS